MANRNKELENYARRNFLKQEVSAEQEDPDESEISADEQADEEARYRARTDLFFLCELLNKPVSEQPHREMCDFFIKKTADGIIPNLKRSISLMMAPRGSWKSTLSMVDAVQWIICYPNIRILVMTPTHTLGQYFIEQVKGYFTVQDPDNPSEFQRLFPEFCVSAKKRLSLKKFTTPARIDKSIKEPTVTYSSIDSTNTGIHCELLKCDDVVTENNSTTDDLIQKCIAKFDMLRKLVDPAGCIELVGTPYDPNDLYAHLQNLMGKNLRIFKRPAWVIDPAYKNVPEKDIPREAYKLFFPSVLTLEVLKSEQALGKDSFASQYLLDPYATTQKMFTESLVRRCIIPWQSIPSQLTYYSVWDLSYGSSGPKADQSSGPVIGIDEQGRMYLVDISFGVMDQKEIANSMARAASKYHLDLLAVENANGVEWLEPTIRSAFAAFGVNPTLYWIPLDRKKDAKKNRILSLIPLMESGRFFISSMCPFVEEIVDSFKTFTGKSTRHDDIPDSISLILNLPVVRNVITEVKKDPAILFEEYRQRALQEMLFPTVQQQQYTQPEPAEPPYREILTYF